MDNHFHIVVETVDGNLSAGMHQLNGVYTQWHNRNHDRVSHVFQSRFKAIMKQIAQAFDVHYVTVSRVLKKGENV